MEFLVPNKKTTGKLGKCREAWLNITNVKLTISKHWYIPARLGWFIRGAFTTMRTKTITRRSLRPGMMEDAKKSFSAFLLCFREEGEPHGASLIPRLNVKSTSSLLNFYKSESRLGGVGIGLKVRVGLRSGGERGPGQRQMECESWL